ncbi:hypothetical protein LTR85_010215 [Meristemomyces frigidus]|nr:hypothetical protein LTR85_010215 [Meristemomyces frigidus]
MAIQRTTCFKMKNEDDIPRMIEQYKLVEKTNQKDGKPYILEVKPSQILSDPRTQGFNFMASTLFASMDDFKYYDEECEAHKKLKAFAQGKVDGPPLLLFAEV